MSAHTQTHTTSKERQWQEIVRLFKMYAYYFEAHKIQINVPSQNNSKK